MVLDKDKRIKIAEIQGLYGPVNISELVLQKIWLRQEFAVKNLRCESGKTLIIKNPGRWNHQEGPDFKLAELLIDGELRLGDVEIHFYAEDWIAHGHHLNPGFDQVILHLILFPSDNPEKQIITHAGNVPETLVFLPLLERDIEEYATEEALLSLEGRENQNRSKLLEGLSIHDRRQLFLKKARIRWEQKVYFAGQRLQRNGWPETCHQTILEILGYSRNRGAMSSIGQRYPLDLMAAGGRDEKFYFEIVLDQWKLAGLRPANHPRSRLRQYLRILKECPEWPEKLIVSEESWYNNNCEGITDTQKFRKLYRLKKWKNFFAGEILANEIGGNRLHTIICDGFLPLLAAAHDHDLFACWFHWYGGDFPLSLRKFVMNSGLCDARVWPLSNGMYQGALQFLIENP